MPFEPTKHLNTVTNKEDDCFLLHSLQISKQTKGAGDMHVFNFTAYNTL